MRTTVISVQPLGTMIDVYAGEIEHALTPSWTLGVGGSNWNPDFGGIGFAYTSVDVKLRYYPEQHALRGFSFGGQGGYSRITTRNSFTDDGSTDRNSMGGPSIGFALDYSWLLGPSQSFYIGLGAGAKKVFASSNDGNAKFRYPTARISVGMAF